MKSPTFLFASLIYVPAIALVSVLITRSAFGARPIEIEWALQPIGGVFSEGYALALGPQGQVYVGGTNFSGAFLSKYDDNGTLIWTRTDARASFGGARAVVADGGNIYVAGTAHRSQHSVGFLTKYDDFGRQQWFVSLGDSAGYGGFNAVAADGLGNVFVAGYTDGDLVGASSGSYDAIIARYGPDGTLLWAKQFGTFLEENVFAVDSDSEGNLYVTGSTNGSLFAVNGSTRERGGGHYGHDVFVRKIDSQGEAIWSRQFGGGSSDMGTGIALDPHGNIFVSGHTGGSISGVSAGEMDVFIEKLDNDGNRQWVRQFGTAKTDWSFDVETDDLGAAFIASNHFDGNNPAESHFDSLVRKFSPEGDLLWHFELATPSHDQAHDVVVNSNGSVFVTGYAGGELFGSNIGGRSGFLVKLREIPESRSAELLLIAVACCFILPRRRLSQ